MNSRKNRSRLSTNRRAASRLAGAVQAAAANLCDHRGEEEALQWR
jgi:hypothetical protein